MSEYTSYGFSGVIAKPYRASELSEILQQVLNVSTPPKEDFKANLG
jgi:Cdc6-like AAA superfamily ATPase